jgi:Helix-turn-helix domain
MSKSVEEQNFLIMAGQSKAERIFQENFVLTDKPSGFEILRKYGTNAFAMWWILQAYCYGKGKAHAFPKLKTLAKDVNKSERTVQRWLDDLEKANGIKIVPCFWEDTGFQASNLYVLNHDFPEVPEWWDTFFQHGAIRKKDENGKDVFYERQEPNNVAPDKNVTPEKSGTTKMSSPENQGSSEQDVQEPNNEGHDKNVTPENSGTTKMSSPENQGSDAKSDENAEIQAPTKMSPQEENKTTSFKENELSIKKKNNNCTYIDYELDTDMGAEKVETNLVVVNSHKSEIKSLFKKTFNMELPSNGMSTLIDLAISNLKANQEEISSDTIVDCIKKYIHNVDQYNRPFRTNAYIVLRNAIRDNYVYVNSDAAEQPKRTSFDRDNKLLGKASKYAALRNRNQTNENNEEDADSNLQAIKVIELKKARLAINGKIAELKRREYLTEEEMQRLVDLKSESERLTEEIEKLTNDDTSFAI